MLAQDPSVLTTSGMTGAYSFDFYGILTGTTQLSMVGEFSADGRGAFNNTSLNFPIPGIMDINNGGNPSQAQISSTSTYSINSNGQGTATVLTTDPSFPNLTFTIYIVSASRAVFIESDGNAVLLGDAIKQQTSTCTWGTNSLNSAAILDTSGRSASGSITDLIRFTANGTDTATAGSNDENNAGVVSSGNSLAGAYSIDSPAGSCGRGTLSLAGPASHSYVFYIGFIDACRGPGNHFGCCGARTIGSAAERIGGAGTAQQLRAGPGRNNVGRGSMQKEMTLPDNLMSADTGSLVANAGGSFGSLDINNSDPNNPGVTQTIRPHFGYVDGRQPLDHGSFFRRRHSEFRSIFREPDATFCDGYGFHRRCPRLAL